MRDYSSSAVWLEGLRAGFLTDMSISKSTNTYNRQNWENSVSILISLC